MEPASLREVVITQCRSGGQDEVRDEVWRDSSLGYLARHLTDETRLAILWIKDVWHHLPTYPYQVVERMCMMQYLSMVFVLQLNLRRILRNVECLCKVLWVGRWCVRA